LGTPTDGDLRRVSQAHEIGSSLPEEKNRSRHDAAAGVAIVLTLFDRYDDVIFKLHHSLGLLLFRLVGELAVDAARNRIAEIRVVVLDLVVDVFESGGLALSGAADLALGGFPQDLVYLEISHADGDFIIRDQFTHDDLAFEDGLNLRGEILVLGSQSRRADPAAYADSILPRAANFVGLLGEADKLDIGINLEGTSLAPTLLSRENPAGFRDLQLDRCFRKLFYVDDIRVVIELGGGRQNSAEEEGACEKNFHRKVKVSGETAAGKAISSFPIRRAHFMPYSGDRVKFPLAPFPIPDETRPMNGPISQKLFEKAKTLIPGGVNSPVRAFRNVDGDPFFVRRGKGSRIEDVDGKTYLDYIGSWGPNILGHAPNVITAAIHEAAKEGISYGIPNPHEVEMAKLITEWVPSVEKVRMVSSGTEATMSAIRLARGFTGRDKIVKFEGCYHGHSDSLLVAAGSGALTFGEPDSAGVPRSFAAETITLPYNNLERLEEIFSQHGEHIAAIIVESYPANAGLVFPREGYLQAMRDLATKHGALIIFDEVMTGFRLAKGGVQELENFTPDLTAMGKVIGGGLPVGAFGGRADIMDMLAPDGPVYQAGTLSGNPLAMVAGLTQLNELSKHSAYDQLANLGDHFATGLRKIMSEKGIPHRVNQVGSMFCLYFLDEEIVNVDTVCKQDFSLFKKLFWDLLEQGVYLAPSPYETGFISMAHTIGDLDDTLTCVEKAVARW